MEMVNGGEKKIGHYSSLHKILLVGEGDFSFAASLATAFASAINIVATSLDSPSLLSLKHPTAKHNLNILEELGGTIIHNVDAHTMSEHSLLRSKSFDRIVFNFPHAGLLFKEHDSYLIKLHKKVLRGFFRSASKMVTENGEVHVTHKTSHPYSAWNIKELAAEAGLVLVSEHVFHTGDYPGYHNKRGGCCASKSNKSFPVGNASTFKFSNNYCF